MKTQMRCFNCGRTAKVHATAKAGQGRYFCTCGWTDKGANVIPLVADVPGERPNAPRGVQLISQNGERQGGVQTGVTIMSSREGE